MAVLAGFLFFTSFAYAQGQGDLDAACAQGNGAQQACAAISAQVSAQSPPGISVSCTWTAPSCIPSIVVSDSIKNPGTASTNLSAACNQGSGSQDVCTSISSGMASAGSIQGVTVECVWNNPGAFKMCSPRITLATSTITDKMVVVGGFIKTMKFYQAGAETTSVIILSDPHVPYVIHTVVDGTNFPGGKDSDTWMTVTGMKDVTPETFDFDSINPSAMADAEKQKIMSQFNGTGGVEIGAGVGPDFTALKAIQTFNWSITLAYDVSKEYAGTAQCNGTFNTTLEQCRNGNQPGDWLKLPECTTPASCPAGTYLKDVPSAGLLTIYNADPSPIYKSTGSTTTTTVSTTSTGASTTTSSTVSTTTTNTGGCTLIGDNPPCGSITVQEIIALITSWANGNATLQNVLNLITAWAHG